MSILKLDTGYEPKMEALKDIRLPIELRNHEGKVIASIYKLAPHSGYTGSVNGHFLQTHTELTHCLEEAFSYMYSEMQNYRKVAEKHDRLTSALKDSLKGIL